MEGWKGGERGMRVCVYARVCGHECRRCRSTGRDTDLSRVSHRHKHRHRQRHRHRHRYRHRHRHRHRQWHRHRHRPERSHVRGVAAPRPLQPRGSPVPPSERSPHGLCSDRKKNHKKGSLRLEAHVFGVGFRGGGLGGLWEVAIMLPRGCPLAAIALTKRCGVGLEVWMLCGQRAGHAHEGRRAGRAQAPRCCGCGSGFDSSSSRPSSRSLV